MMRNKFFLLLVLFPLSAAAQETDLGQARRHFEWMEYDKAEAAAVKALASAKSGPKEVVEAYRIIGLCQSARGKTRQAQDTFLRLLALQPDFSPGDDISPKLLGPFEQAKKVRRSSVLELRHTPPPARESLAGAELKATLPANPFALAATLRLRWRQKGSENWQEQTKRAGAAGDYVFSLPATLGTGEIEYYFEALNGSGAALKSFPAGEPWRLAAQARPPPKVALAEVPEKLAPEAVSPTAPIEESVPPTVVEEESRPEWYESWWFWTLVGAVVAGGVTAGAVAATRPSGGPADYQIVFR